MSLLGAWRGQFWGCFPGTPSQGMPEGTGSWPLANAGAGSGQRSHLGPESPVPPWPKATVGGTGGDKTSAGRWQRDTDSLARLSPSACRPHTKRAGRWAASRLPPRREGTTQPEEKKKFFGKKKKNPQRTPPTVCDGSETQRRGRGGFSAACQLVVLPLAPFSPLLLGHLCLFSPQLTPTSRELGRGRGAPHGKRLSPVLPSRRWSSRDRSVRPHRSFIFHESKGKRHSLAPTPREGTQETRPSAPPHPVEGLDPPGRDGSPALGLTQLGGGTEPPPIPCSGHAGDGSSAVLRHLTGLVAPSNGGGTSPVLEPALPREKAAGCLDGQTDKMPASTTRGDGKHVRAQACLVHQLGPPGQMDRQQITGAGSVPANDAAPRHKPSTRSGASRRRHRAPASCTSRTADGSGRPDLPLPQRSPSSSSYQSGVWKTTVDVLIPGDGRDAPGLSTRGLRGAAGCRAAA